MGDPFWCWTHFFGSRHGFRTRCIRGDSCSGHQPIRNPLSGNIDFSHLALLPNNPTWHPPSVSGLSKKSATSRRGAFLFDPVRRTRLQPYLAQTRTHMPPSTHMILVGPTSVEHPQTLQKVLKTAKTSTLSAKKRKGPDIAQYHVVTPPRPMWAHTLHAKTRHESAPDCPLHSTTCVLFGLCRRLRVKKKKKLASDWS